MAKWFASFAQSFVDLVWGMPMVYILTGAGLMFTILTLGVQFRALTHGFAVVRGKYDNPEDEGNISHFQALCTALSATVGLGNISGVAVAVAAGGAGAVFWMWIVGLLGMATKFMTCSLATMYREEDHSGTFRGGPMYYIEIGLGKQWKPLAIAFAVFGCLACLGAGNMFQSHEVAESITNMLNELSSEGITDTNQLWVRLGVGAVVFVLAILVIIGGIRRIGNVASKIVPTMCLAYVTGAIVVIVMNIGEVPDMFASIFRNAFAPAAAKGAFWGIIVKEAITLGVKRACFSNEAGLGSAPMAHATAKTNEPIREGVVAALGPFIDTVVICTMTALVILITQSHVRQAVATITNSETIAVTSESGDTVDYLEITFAMAGDAQLRQGAEIDVMPPPDARDINKDGSENNKKSVFKFSVPEGASTKARYELTKVKSGDDAGQKQRKELLTTAVAGNPVYLHVEGIALTAYAFNSVLPGFGKWFLPIAVFFFAFSTIISWGYYGETCFRYLFGDRGLLPFKLVYVSMILIGASIQDLKPVLNMSDSMLGLMLVPNMIGTVLLMPKVLTASREYFRRLDAGEFAEEARRAAEAKAQRRRGS